MKYTANLILTMLLLATPSFAQDKSKLPSKEKVQAAIETFSKSSLTPEGKAAAAEIISFFSDPRSTNYARVSLFPEFSPGLERDQPANFQQAIRTLRVAGLAG